MSTNTELTAAPKAGKNVPNPVTTSLAVGFAYGIYRVVGPGAQGAVNIAAYYAGLELARRLRDQVYYRSRSPAEAVEKLGKAIGLADKVEAKIGDK